MLLLLLAMSSRGVSDATLELSLLLNGRSFVGREVARRVVSAAAEREGCSCARFPFFFAIRAVFGSSRGWSRRSLIIYRRKKSFSSRKKYCSVRKIFFFRGKFPRQKGFSREVC